MKKICLFIGLLFLINIIFAQPSKITIGGFTLYDSSGVLVIKGGKVNVLDTGWVNSADLSYLVAGLGISKNSVLGLRVNLGSGMTTSGDTLVTQDASGIWDSVSINGIILKNDGGVLTTSSSSFRVGDVSITDNGGKFSVGGTTDSISTEAVYTNFLLFGKNAYNLTGNFEGKIFTDVGANFLIYGGDGSDVKIGSDEGTYYLNIGELGTTTAVFPILNFTAGDSVKIGTTDNFDLRFKRNNEVYLTLSSANLIIAGNTPLKFASADVFNAGALGIGTLNNLPTSGDPVKFLVIYDENGSDYAIPLWAIP